MLLEFLLNIFEVRHFIITVLQEGHKIQLGEVTPINCQFIVCVQEDEKAPQSWDLTHLGLKFVPLEVPRQS